MLALVASLRAGSVNRQIGQVASGNGPDGTSVAVYDGLGDIPFHDEDIDGAEAPAAAQSLRAAVADVDAVLVITPEYNATISGGREERDRLVVAAVQGGRSHR
ncbi:NAD(P)H-dependent FMN reductase [Mycobacterium sp. MAA66]